MPQPTAKTLTLRVPLTNAEGKTAVLEAVYALPLDELLRASKEELEAAYVAQFAIAVLNQLVHAGGVSIWGMTIGQPEATWGKPKPVVLLPGRVA